jgi:hypothetical protein
VNNTDGRASVLFSMNRRAEGMALIQACIPIAGAGGEADAI